MDIKKFFQRFSNKFSTDETTTLAASLAFYTALSLAPLLILFVTISAHFGPELQHDFIASVKKGIGSEGASAMQMVISSAKDRPDLTSLASAFGVLTLLMSASLIFGELRNALNRIFCVEPRRPKDESYGAAIWHMVRERLVAIVSAVGFIFTLIATLIASSLIVASVHSHYRLLASLINISLSFLFFLTMFTLMFRFLPDRRQPWKRAAQGGALTAALFVVGKELIALYLGNSAIGSAYGAAGSLIVLLVWVYYSTLITFIGAQVSALLIGVRRKATV